MRVTINHVEANVGMVFKKAAAAIEVKVEFSDTEKAVLKRSGIADHVFYTAPVNKHYKERMQHLDHTAADLLKDGMYVVFDDDITRRVEDPKIRAGLKNLKDALDVAEAPTKQSDSFEL